MVKNTADELSVFGHFVGLALKGLIHLWNARFMRYYVVLLYEKTGSGYKQIAGQKREPM